MSEYSKKQENQSRTPGSNPHSARQASVAVILQAYMNGKINQCEKAENDKPFQNKPEPIQREETEGDKLAQGKFGVTSPTGLNLPDSSVCKPAGKTVQRDVKIADTAITINNVEAALITAFLQSKVKFPEIRDPAYQGKKEKQFFTSPPSKLGTMGTQLRDGLFAQYTTNARIDLNLTDADSFSSQVAQDANLLIAGETNLIGNSHQFNEYNQEESKRTPGHINRTDMRIYRCMSLADWNNAKLSGHGGSLGQALHYFRLDKKSTKSSVLVEFTLTGNSLNDMIGTLGTDKEGSHSDEGVNAGKFGRKTERNSAFKEENIFSVDMKHAVRIINEKATCRIVASTGTPPTATTIQNNGNWS